MSLLKEVREQHAKRISHKEPVFIEIETDMLRDMHYITFKQSDLKFKKRMSMPDDDVVTEWYRRHGQTDETYFLPHFKLYKNLLFSGEPILILTLSGTYACLENLCWVVFTPNRSLNRQDPVFVEKIILLYNLLDLRIRILLDMKNNFNILDAPEFTVKFSEKNISCNMFFVQCVGAYMDELFLTIYDSTPIVGEDVHTIFIPEDDKQYVFDTFLKEITHSLLLSKYEEFLALLIITDADKYVHYLKFSFIYEKTKDASMILQNKNDVVYKQLDDKTTIQQLMQIPTFIDFCFAYAYKQCFYKDIEYKRHRFYDLYMTNLNTYTSLSGLIYANYRDVLLKNKNVKKEMSIEEFYNELEDEDEQNLEFLFPD